MNRYDKYLTFSIYLWFCFEIRLFVPSYLSVVVPPHCFCDDIDHAFNMTSDKPLVLVLSGFTCFIGKHDMLSLFTLWFGYINSCHCNFHELIGLIGSMPLQLSWVGKMPLQKSKLEICHYNYLILLSMPFSLLNRITIQKIHVFQCVFQYWPYYLVLSFGQHFYVLRTIQMLSVHRSYKS
jgi:hypothetical protein